MPVQDLKTPVWEQLNGDRVALLPRAWPLHCCGGEDWVEQFSRGPRPLPSAQYNSTGQNRQPQIWLSPHICNLVLPPLSPTLAPTCSLLLSPISPATPSLVASFFILSLPFFCNLLRSRLRKWATSPEISRLTEGDQKEPVGRGALHLNFAEAWLLPLLPKAHSAWLLLYQVTSLASQQVMRGRDRPWEGGGRRRERGEGVKGPPRGRQQRATMVIPKPGPLSLK